jgi:hypothetical protein
MQKRWLWAAVVAVLTVAFTTPALAEDRASVWVTTFDHDFYNWATPHDQTFAFPPLAEEYTQVLLHHAIECPTAPADCDPWDRLGWLRILHEEPDLSVTQYEIARIITPYDITGGSRPGTCTWVLDVTDYRFLLHDQVTLRNYSESWIGDNRGWIVSPSSSSSCPGATAPRPTTSSTCGPRTTWCTGTRATQSRTTSRRSRSPSAPR